MPDVAAAGAAFVLAPVRATVGATVATLVPAALPALSEARPHPVIVKTTRAAPTSAAPARRNADKRAKAKTPERWVVRVLQHSVTPLLQHSALLLLFSITRQLRFVLTSSPTLPPWCPRPTRRGVPRSA